MNTNNLPPLPEYHTQPLDDEYFDCLNYYTADQMREYGQLCRQQLLDIIEQQQETLVFVERWACHHGAKPHVAAEQALSFIQHYPPIKEITESYVDGVIPQTYNPYEVIEQQRKLLERARTTLCEIDLAIDLSKHEYAPGLTLLDQCKATTSKITSHLRQQESEKK